MTLRGTDSPPPTPCTVTQAWRAGRGWRRGYTWTLGETKGLASSHRKEWGQQERLWAHWGQGSGPGSGLHGRIFLGKAICPLGLGFCPRNMQEQGEARKLLVFAEEICDTTELALRGAWREQGAHPELCVNPRESQFGGSTASPRGCRETLDRVSEPMASLQRPACSDSVLASR